MMKVRWDDILHEYRSSRIHSHIESVQSATRWPWTRNLRFLFSPHAVWQLKDRNTTLPFTSHFAPYPMTQSTDKPWNKLWGMKVELAISSQLHVAQAPIILSHQSLLKYYFTFVDNSNFSPELQILAESFNYTIIGLFPTTTYIHHIELFTQLPAH